MAQPKLPFGKQKKALKVKLSRKKAVVVAKPKPKRGKVAVRGHYRDLPR